jgi:DNA invertase Pin-like site-specific DNA recombinase
VIETALLDRIEANGVRVVIIEDASRFARKLLTQELGIIALAERGVRVVTANGDDLTNTDDEMRVAMRQIAGSVRTELSPDRFRDFWRD